MWEISLNLLSENIALGNILLKAIIPPIQELGGVVTKNEDNGYFSILVGVSERDKHQVSMILSSCIIELICTNFKLDFLNKHLFLPEHDKIGMTAFKKALLNFDKETDRFIIRKNLNLDQDVFIESFYHFRLKPLQDKWAELVALSNENRDYLISSESFIDLLKFLIDNLDICEDEISIVKEDEGYKIFLHEDQQYENRVFNDESMISSVIDLSPQKINLYFKESSNAINLIKQIFEERVSVVSAAPCILRKKH